LEHAIVDAQVSKLQNSNIILVVVEWLLSLTTEYAEVLVKIAWQSRIQKPHGEESTRWRR